MSQSDSARSQRLRDRYANMCAGAVWSVFLMCLVLLPFTLHRIFIPGFLPILGVGVLSMLAYAIGYGYGKLVEDLNGALLRSNTTIEPPLGVAILVGLGLGGFEFAIDSGIYNARIATLPDSAALFGIGILFQVLVSIACILAALTLGRFAKVETTISRSRLHWTRAFFWVAGSCGVPLLVILTAWTFTLVHDHRHSQFRPDLARYRQLAGSRLEDPAKYYPARPAEVRPKMLVVNEQGWIDDRVQALLGAQGAVTGSEVRTLVVRNRGPRGVLIMDLVHSTVVPGDPPSTSDESLAEYLKALPEIGQLDR